MNDFKFFNVYNTHFTPLRKPSEKYHGCCVEGVFNEIKKKFWEGKSYED